MLHLFATLPAEAAHKIPAKAGQTSRRLALEWQSYVVRTHALRKVFVSVKGFYYQAEVVGQQVTWLVPHHLAQVSRPLWLALCTAPASLSHHPKIQLHLQGPLWRRSNLGELEIFYVQSPTLPPRAKGKRVRLQTPSYSFIL